MADSVIETGAVTEVLPSSGGDAPPQLDGGRLNIPEPAEPRVAAPKTGGKAPPKRITARERMFSSLDKTAGVETSSPSPPSAKAEETKGDTPAGDQTSSPETKPPAGESAPEGTPEAGKPSKVSPWRLVETYKEKTKQLEAEVVDLKGRIKPETDYRVVQERAEKAEKALEEAQNILRLTKYEASSEYQEKHEKPWQGLWQKIAKNMAEIGVTDPTNGQQRPATVHDFELLVNAPLGRARQMAEELFGNFANDAMNLRGKVLDLWEAREQAVEEAKKNGAEHERQTKEQFEKQSTALRQEIHDSWQKSNKEVVEHEKYGHYFRPREGDQEWNQRLTKGTELVDRAFATLKPDFSGQESRAEVIKRHAVIRHRAIAFGPLRWENEQLRKERDSWKAKYEAISRSTPPAGQGAQRNSEAAGAPRSAREAMFGRLEELSKPH